MFYRVKFTVDTGTSFEDHIAIVNADSGTSAINKVDKYVSAGLRSDEWIPRFAAEPIENSEILYCSYTERYKREF